jgi:hypothetical protein
MTVNSMGALFAYDITDFQGNTGAGATGTILSFQYTVAADFIGKIAMIGGIETGKVMLVEGMDPIDAETSNVAMWNGSIYEDTAIDGAVIYSTPEPVTIALLGLGGLFLRRKK